MRVDVLWIPEEANRVNLMQKTVVVIDILRATSTVAAALHNGARRVVPVALVREAFQIKGDLKKVEPVLVGGERQGLPVEGFDLGNSPQEYSPEMVQGKTVVLTTTNGTKAIRVAASRMPGEVLTASLLNVTATARYLASAGRDSVIICSGQDGDFALEDLVGAGHLTQEVIRLAAEGLHSEDVVVNDAGLAAMRVAQSYPDLREAFRASRHGRELVQKGFGSDLDFCAGKNLAQDMVIRLRGLFLYPVGKEDKV